MPARAPPTRLLTEISLRFATGNLNTPTSDSIVAVNIFPATSAPTSAAAMWRGSSVPPRHRPVRPITGLFEASRAPSKHPTPTLCRHVYLHHNSVLNRPSIIPRGENRRQSQNSKTSTGSCRRWLLIIVDV